MVILQPCVKNFIMEKNLPLIDISRDCFIIIQTQKENEPIVKSCNIIISEITRESKKQDKQLSIANHFNKMANNYSSISPIM